MARSGEQLPVTIFAPDPLLSVTIEARGSRDELHLHAAGQGAWVARMAAELGAAPVLCCMLGGEIGATLLPLLEAIADCRVVQTAGTSGSYVTDRRAGCRRLVAAGLRDPPRRHEVDDLVAVTCAAALRSAVLVVCNPYPTEGLADEVYETVVANARAAGTAVIVDLSSPRLERTLAYGPNLVKLNDWELAQYVCGPVDGERALDAVRRLQDAGARAVALTRGGGPILVLPADGDPFEIVPPKLEHGFREGCGDSMTGAIAAAWARGMPLVDALVLGAAAGSANFLRHGLGTGKRAVVEQLVRSVDVRMLSGRGEFLRTAV